MTEQPTGYQLAHPVYLDVAMMISFLAYLEGGVVTPEEATQKRGRSQGTDIERAGRTPSAFALGA